MSTDKQLAEEKQVMVSPIEVPELSKNANVPPELNQDMNFIKDIPITISVELGRIQMNVESILSLALGSLVTLKRQVNEPIDLLINDRLIGHGEIVAVDDCFGIRVVELLDRGETI